jgi:PAS domain S-box-containing protein
MPPHASSPGIRYGAAVVCAAAAVLLRVGLTSVWGLKFPYLTFYPAVLVAAWIGGFGPGLLTTLLCGLSAAYFWLPPLGSVAIAAIGDRISMGGFLLIGLTISALNELLQRRERYAQNVIEGVTDAFAILDRKWRYRVANEQMIRLTRRPRQDLIGHSFWTVSPQLVGTDFEAVARRAVTTGQPERFEFFYPTLGAWAEVHLYPSREGVALYLRDIAAQKQIEQMSSRLAAIVESSDDAIVGKDTNGVVQSWNAAAERVFGWTAEEAIGRHITFIIPPDRHYEEDHVLARIRRGEKVDHFETVRVHKDGRLLDIALTISPIRDSSGRIIGASKIARDITARKQVERDLAALLAREQAARADAEAANRAKDDFLTTLSHELRTPLNAVYGWAAMLRAGQLDAPTLHKAIDAIMRNANAQVQLIDDLLDVSRIASGKLRLDMQPVAPRDAIEAAVEAVRPAALAKEIQVHLDLAADTGPITGDANRLQQIVWNLLSNAVKFTPSGGRVGVRLRTIGGYVEIAVTDTGAGIASDFLPHVFERFRQEDSSSTRAHGGLGLGLTLVKQLVELHGGSVRAESAGIGRGATFTIVLPCRPAALAPAATDRHPTSALAVPLPRSSELTGIRVLVIDDDLDGAILLTTILERAGALVEAAHSAAEGFKQFSTAPPDVLISDIEMPEEDGYSLISRIRAREPAEGGRVPAIALTAYGRREDRLHAIAAGYSMHVPKPVDPAELLTLVASLARR